ncbi:MAG: hypothetical protein AAFZ38_05770 [Myxococcota bacterium]
MNIQCVRPFETTNPSRYTDSPPLTGGASAMQPQTSDRVLRAGAPLTQLAWTGDEVALSAESRLASSVPSASPAATESTTDNEAACSGTRAETSGGAQAQGIIDHLVRAVDSALRLDWRSSIRHALSGVFAWLRDT